MFRLLCATVLVALVSAEEADPRFFFVPQVKTLTSFSIIPATTTVTTTPFCYTVAPLLSLSATISTTVTTQMPSPGNCRKRRWAFENPVEDELNALLVGSPMEASIVKRSALPGETEEVERSIPDSEFEIDSSIDAVRVAREVDGRFFNVITTTVTTVTAFTTQTNMAATKTLTIGCTPISYTAMKAC